MEIQAFPDCFQFRLAIVSRNGFDNLFLGRPPIDASKWPVISGSRLFANLRHCNQVGITDGTEVSLWMQDVAATK